MVERNAEAAADIGQLGGIYAPDLTGEANGAPEGDIGVRHACGGATGPEHTLVKARVVRDEEIRPGEHRPNSGP